MKKTLSIVLTLAMLVGMLPMVAMAAAPALTTDIGEKDFTAGASEWVEFSFSTVAGDAAGTMVYGGSDFGVLYEDKIAALEYKAGDQWFDMKGQNFGGAQGFPMADATSTFRVKFTQDAGGDYTFIATMKKVEDDSVLCSVNVPFTVNGPKLTTDIGEKNFVAGGDWVEFNFSTVADTAAGTMVYGGSDFGVLYEDKIAALEYKAGDQWIDMKGQNFGGAQGFPMADATSTFRVKFTEDAAGDYSFVASMKKVDDDSVLCSVNVPFTVNAKTVYGGPVMNQNKIAAAANGYVKTSPIAASEGATITIYSFANEGYELSSITVLDKDGQALELTQNSAGRWTYKVPAGGVSVTPVFTQK